MKTFLKKIFASLVSRVMTAALIMLLIVSVFASVQYRNSRQEKNHLEMTEGDEEGMDGPDSAMYQNFLMTRDPALEYPPSERMQAVRDLVDGGTTAAKAIQCVTWEERGPNNVGGRTRAIMFDPNDPSHKKVWAGGVAGGLWSTPDITVASPVWTKVNDFWDNLAISCIAYDPSNTQIFYVGTGEGWLNIDAVRGAGIWKTSNGGTTWSQLTATATPDFYYTQKIVVTATGVVYAGTYHKGVMKSTNNGSTWSNVLGTAAGVNIVNNAYGGGTSTVYLDRVADLEIGADGTIYASIGIFLGEGVFRLSPGNTVWDRLSVFGSGFPVFGSYHRIELACAPSDANVMYAFLSSQSYPYGLAAALKTSNKGNTWSSLNPAVVGNNAQAFYNMIAAISPTNPATIIYGQQTAIQQSNNSGATWFMKSNNIIGNSGYCHADYHGLLFQPGTNNMLVSCDGGIYYALNITAPGIGNFQSKNTGYNVTQFYSGAMHPTSTNYFLGGTQDNDVPIFTTAGMNSTTPVNFQHDGGYCFIDATPTPTYVASWQGNYYFKSSTGLTNSFTTLLTSGNGRFVNPADYDYRYHILYSANSLTAIEMVEDVNTASPVSSLITVTGMSTLPTAIKVSPYAANASTVFVASGADISNPNALPKLVKIINTTTTPVFTNITLPVISQGSTVSCIEMGLSEQDLLLIYSNYGVASVWETHDGGTTWFNKEGNLPDMPIRWALYNPINNKEVLLATEAGVWSTNDITVLSPDWGATNSPLARTRVDMLRYRASDKLVLAATHGRGIFTSAVFNHPVANFSFPGFVACSGATVNFTNSSSNNPVSYLWNFGDPASGGNNTSTLTNPNHVYAIPGTYYVTLTATNSYGCSSITLPVMIGPWVKKTGNDLGGDYGGDVTVDATGNSYITGSYTGTLTMNGISITNGNQDVYVAKINAAGTALWMTSLFTGTVNPLGRAIYLDAAGNIYVTASSKYNIYFAKLNSAGVVQWSQSLVQTANQGTQQNITGGHDIAVDASGNVFVTGRFATGIKFDGVNTVKTVIINGVDMFLTKFNSSGVFQWVVHETGSGNGVALDATGNPVVTGQNATQDVLFKKYTTSGGVVWNKPQATSASNNNWGSGIGIDNTGNIYITGSFAGTSIFGPTDQGLGVPMTSAGLSDIFYGEYDASGYLILSRKFGGPGEDNGIAVRTEGASNNYLTGSFSGAATFTSVLLNASGAKDIFTCQVNTSGTVLWAYSYGGAGDYDTGNGIYSDANAIYETGNFTQTATFGSNSLSTFSPNYSAYLKKICKSIPILKEANDAGAEESLAADVKVYPNPSNGIVHINLVNRNEVVREVRIFNSAGSRMRVDKPLIKDQEDYSIDLGKLPAGIYFIECILGTKTVTKKIMLL